MKDYKQKLRNIFSFLADAVSSNPEEARKYLKEKGVDPSKVGKEGEAFAQRLLSRREMELARTERQKKSENQEDYQSVNELIKGKFKSAKEALFFVLEHNPQAKKIAFRNVKEISEQDAEHILVDLHRAGELEETLEKKDKGEK